MFLKNMNPASSIRLFTIFLLTLSMVSFSGSIRIAPALHLVHADLAPPAPSSLVTQWAPAGAMEDKILITTYSDEGSEFSALKANTLDLTDWTLSAADVPSSCPTGSSAILCDSRFYVTDKIAGYGMFGVDFNEANTFFGINFGYAKDTSPDSLRAINFRQGVAHLISRQDVVTSQFGSLGQAMDNPLPPGQSFPHSGLPSDPTSLGAAGIGPYSFGGYSLQGVCGAGTGATNTGWDSLDAQFRAAGQICKSAFKYGLDTVDSAGVVTASAANPDFCDAADHWIAAGLATGRSTVDCHLTGIVSALLTGAITFIVRRDDPPRLNFGQALASRMCELINGAGVTTCSQVVVNLLSINEARPIVFSTNIVHLEWHMYTKGWSLGPTPEQIWSLYNSAFAGQFCGGVPAFFGTDYVYVCNSRFDKYNSMVEFNSTSAGALAALQVSNEIYGNHTFAIDIYAQANQFAYRREWTGVNAEKGIGPPNYFTILNAWTSNPAIPGELRWGFKQGTSQVNPLTFISVWEGYVVSEVFDTLLAANPYSPTDLYGWMVNDWQVIAPQPGDPSGTVSDIKFSLRSDIFFHDGVQLTSSDFMFSWQAFASTGGVVNPLTAGIVGVKVLNTVNFIVNLNSNSVFALFNAGGIPILPQHILAQDTITKCTTVGTPACTLVSDAATTDPVSSYRYIGSGPYICLDSVANKVGGKCTATGNQSVPSGSSIVLSRNGLGQSGTANSAYFRDSAKYKQWQWADVFSHGRVDILDVSSAASCLGKIVTGGQNPNCLHWDTPAAHITCVATAGSCNTSSLAGLGGNNGGTVTFIEIQQAFRWFGVTWTTPFSYASLSSTTGCGGAGCGAQPVPQTLYEGGVQYAP